MRIGIHQLRLLIMTGSPTCILLTPDRSSDGLVKRGLLRKREDGACSVTPAGLRALADEMEAGRVEDALELMRKDRAAMQAHVAERSHKKRGIIYFSPLTGTRE